MSSTDDLLTMLYWVLGMVLVIFIIDWFWLKPYQEHLHTDRIIKRLRQKNPTFYQSLPKFSGRGIVMVIDESTLLAGVLLIITLRKILCKLPVLVYHTGDGLTEDNRQFLESIQGVMVKPAMDHCKSQARVYALIYSPFREVLLLEPDLLFFRDPEYLFADPQYHQTGALFWKDRKIQTIWDKKVYDWTRRLIPYRKGDNQILDKQAGNFQSRELLLMDKATHLKTLEKLWVLTNESDTVYGVIPNDKECYWIAAELAKEHYAFVRWYPGVIGELTRDLLCGHVLYADHTGQLLAWDASLFRDSDQRHVTDFTHYALFERDAGWTKSSNKCLKNAEPRQLPDDLRSLINEYALILHDLGTHLYKASPPKEEPDD